VSSTPPTLPTTIEECHALILRLLPLVEEVERLRARVEELERRLNQSSQNSSRPPSSDPPFIKRLPKKEPTGRQPGGQRGHKGHHRMVQPPEKVDEVLHHWPTACENCGHELPSGLRMEVGEAERHQVAEIPMVMARVTEHHLHAQHCPGCGWATSAQLPGDVPHGAFGPRLVAVTALLSGCYRLSKRTIEEMLHDLFGVSMSLGSVVACEQTTSAIVAPAMEEARAYVQQQAVAHADETGWREARKKAWLWVLATTFVVVFLIHRRRNTMAARELLGVFDGTLVADRWSAYNAHEGRRQLCWAHLRRDFQALSECQGKMGLIGKDLVRLTRRMFRWWYRVRDGTVDRAAFRRKMKPLRGQIERLLEQAVSLAVPRASGLCRDIGKRADALWTFVEVEDVEPTNNFAERVLRPAVLYRKSSFGTHSEAGSRFVERLLTVRATLRQQGRNVVDYVTQAVEASLRGLPAPSLLPPSAAVELAAA
jgi:transposase